MNYGRLIGHEKQYITLCGSKGRTDCLPLLVSKKLGDGRLPLALLFHLDPGKPLGPELSYIIGKIIQVLAGKGRAALGIYGPYQAAFGGDRLEHLETAIPGDPGQIHQLQTKPCIRPVCAKTGHGLFMGHPGKGHNKVNILDLFEELDDHPLDNGIDILFLHE